MKEREKKREGLCVHACLHVGVQMWLYTREHECGDLTSVREVHLPPVVLCLFLFPKTRSFPEPDIHPFSKVSGKLAARVTLHPLPIMKLGFQGCVTMPGLLLFSLRIRTQVLMLQWQAL